MDKVELLFKRGFRYDIIHRRFININVYDQNQEAELDKELTITKRDEQDLAIKSDIPDTREREISPENCTQKDYEHLTPTKKIVKRAEWMEDVEEMDDDENPLKPGEKFKYTNFLKRPWDKGCWKPNQPLRPKYVYKDMIEKRICIPKHGRKPKPRLRYRKPKTRKYKYYANISKKDARKGDKLLLEYDDKIGEFYKKIVPDDKEEKYPKNFKDYFLDENIYIDGRYTTLRDEWERKKRLKMLKEFQIIPLTTEQTPHVKLKMNINPDDESSAESVESESVKSKISESTMSFSSYDSDNNLKNELTVKKKIQKGDKYVKRLTMLPNVDEVLILVNGKIVSTNIENRCKAALYAKTFQNFLRNAKKTLKDYDPDMEMVSISVETWHAEWIMTSDNGGKDNDHFSIVVSQTIDKAPKLPHEDISMETTKTINLSDYPKVWVKGLEINDDGFDFINDFRRRIGFSPNKVSEKARPMIREHFLSAWRPPYFVKPSLEEEIKIDERLKSSYKIKDIRQRLDTNWKAIFDKKINLDLVNEMNSSNIYRIDHVYGDDDDDDNDVITCEGTDLFNPKDLTEEISSQNTSVDESSSISDDVSSEISKDTEHLSILSSSANTNESLSSNRDPYEEIFYETSGESYPDEHI